MEPITEQVSYHRCPVCQRIFWDRDECVAHIAQCRKRLGVDTDIVGKTVMRADDSDLYVGIVRAVVPGRRLLLVDAVSVDVHWGVYRIRHDASCLIPIGEADVVDPERAMTVFRNRVRSIAERRLDGSVLVNRGDGE